MHIGGGPTRVPRSGNLFGSKIGEVAGAYLASLFENTDLAAIHAKCMTILPKDLYLV